MLSCQFNLQEEEEEEEEVSPLKVAKQLGMPTSLCLSRF